MTESDYLELLDFVRRWEQRDPWDKTEFGKKVVEQSKEKIQEYENDNSQHKSKILHSGGMERSNEI